jgi:FeS assembly protein IscX
VPTDTEETLTWDDSYAIARALHDQYPSVIVDEVSLGMIYQLTIALPQFHDDPELANDSILSAIYQEWYEEANPI